MIATVMGIARASFWVCSTLILYTYFCYPIVLFVAYSIAQLKRDLRYLAGRLDRRVRTASISDLPTVSLLVPAHNEEKHLPRALESLQQLDYPKDKLEIIIISDGSTDGTNEILRNVQTPFIRTILSPERQGKSAALNRAASEAKGSILLLSDASTLLPADGVHKLVRHFNDKTVGAACGSLDFIGSDESKRTEGVYWRYESALRLMEARLGATMTASGAYYAIRRECYRELAAGTILDDFVIPMNVRKQGYDVVYDPEAVAKEWAAETVAGEFRRRVRIAAGSFRALPALSRTPMQIFTWVVFLSHKVLRWVMPFFFIGVMLSNLLLTANGGIYLAAFAAQLGFYLLALSGMISARHNVRIPGLVCYFFCAMNLAFLVGFFRAMKGGTQGLWQRAD